MSNYNPRDWYWVVAGDPTQVFSSALGAYVPVDDATYAAWLGTGDNRPTPIGSENSLGEVLAPYLLRPSHVGVLAGYIGSQADTVLSHLAFKVLFNHENRIRALEGKAAVTVAQARATIRALM